MGGEKPGWKTTEFWMTVVVMVVGAIVTSGIVDKTDTPIDNQVLGIVVAVLAALGYSISRGLAKMNR